MTSLASFVRIAVLSLLLCTLFAGTAAFAQEAVTSATPDVIKDLRSSAAADREHAATRQMQSKAIRDQVDSALASAQSGSAAERASWRSIARERQADADKIDSEIARLLQRADEKESRANALAAAYAEKFPPAPPAVPEEQTASDPSPPLHFPVEDVLGVWRPTAGDAYPFVIVQADPESAAYPYRLEAHTRDRVWTGRYTSFDAGHIARDQNARIVFRYKPKPEEMNPELPLWVRNELAGELEWRIEIDEAGDEIDPRLKARWFPGKVEWKEDASRGARLIGDGEPREFELEPEYRLDLEEMSQPVLTVSLPGPHDPLLEPIEALLELQRFFVKVSLPAELAQKQGRTLVVAVRGMKDGETTTLILEASGVTGYRPVTYSHRVPVTISSRGREPLRDPQVMSMAWIFGVEGTRLDVAIDNGEEVEFRFGDAYQRIPVFDSWVQRGLERHAQARARLEVVYNSVLAGEFSPEQKDAARQKLNLLANYERLLRSDRLTDVHRHELGRVYFDSGDAASLSADSETPGADETPPQFQEGGALSAGLVMMTSAELEWAFLEAIRSRRFEQRSPYIHPMLQAYLEGISGEDLASRVEEALSDIPWTSPAERHFVGQSVHEVSWRLGSTIVPEALEAYAFGLYDGLVTSTPGISVSTLWLVATGTDHFGRRASKWERALAAIGLAADATLSISGSNAARAFSKPVRGSPLGKISWTERALGISASGAVRRMSRSDLDVDLPRSLSRTQSRQTRLEFKADIPTSAGTGCAPRGSRGPAAIPILSEAEYRRSLDEVELDLRYVTNLYGKTARLADPFGERLFEIQRQRTCNAVATNWVIYKRTGRRLNEADSMEVLDRISAQEVIDKRRAASDLARGFGRAEGYPQDLIRRYARLYGARVAEVPKEMNKGVRLKYVHALIQAGYDVKLAVHFPNRGADSFHAIVIEAVEMNALGRATTVRFFDPNVGRLIEMPAGDFKKLIPTKLDTNDPKAWGILTVFGWSSQ